MFSAPQFQQDNRRSVVSLECPRAMIGRIIGRNGETIKALQMYTGCLIQIDQTRDPTVVTISGNPQSLSLAISMCTDIIKGTFKGFALLRQVSNPGVQVARGGFPSQMIAQRPVYAPGFGLIPPSQLFGPADMTLAPIGAPGASGTVGPMLMPTFARTMPALPTPSFAYGQVAGTSMVPGLQPVQIPGAHGTQKVYGLPTASATPGGFTTVYMQPGGGMDFGGAASMQATSMQAAGLPGQSYSDGFYMYPQTTDASAAMMLSSTTDGMGMSMSMAGLAGMGMGGGARVLGTAGGMGTGRHGGRHATTGATPGHMAAAAGSAAGSSVMLGGADGGAGGGAGPHLVMDASGQLFTYHQNYEA